MTQFETGDPYMLDRFVDAQRGVYERVVQELQAGEKRSHWIWFIFPQVEGLGHSSTAGLYSIKSWDETVSYAEHPLLGKRLIECTELVLGHADKTISEIMSYPDDLKFRSSMSLFAQASQSSHVYRSALDVFWGGMPDQKTLQILDSFHQKHDR